MCTSTASKPARSKAAAISICPLTPCSRRMATRGRAPPRARSGAATSSSMSNVGATDSPGSSLSTRAACSSSAQVGSSRSACMRVRRLRPDAAQDAAPLLEHRAAVAAQDDAVAALHAPERAARRRRGRGAPSTSRTRATSAARTAAPRPAPRRTAPRADRRPRPPISTSRPTPPANAISSSVTNRPPSERSWYAASDARGGQLLDRREEARRAAPGRRDRAASRRAGRRPAPAPSRPGGSCRARDRRAAARRRRRRRRPQLGRQRAAHVA